MKRRSDFVRRALAGIALTFITLALTACDPPHGSRRGQRRALRRGRQRAIQGQHLAARPRQGRRHAADLSLSGQWSDVSPNQPPRLPEKTADRAPRESSRPPAPTRPADLQLSSDDLMVHWGKVGVQVCEAATTLFELSKKNVVGDGTYLGFVSAALREVPNASAPRASLSGPVNTDDFGYLVYAQSGPAVQRRASDIMPGDVIVLEEAKLKGHKGLQTYHMTAGTPGEPCIGIVSDFEAKKSKVKVFQANRHVGQQVSRSQCVDVTLYAENTRFRASSRSVIDWMT